MRVELVGVFVAWEWSRMTALYTLPTQIISHAQLMMDEGLLVGGLTSAIVVSSGWFIE